MAKKILCIVLSMTMLLGIFAIASSAAGGYKYDGPFYDYTPETAAEAIAAQDWYEDYDADVDWKDKIDRKFLTGTYTYDGSAEVAAPEEILEYNLYFWKDEIIEAYHSAQTNEDYWNLYNKMATPVVADFTYTRDADGVTVTESDILYDFCYYYRDESKAVFDIDIRADVEYAKPGDIVTVEVYATNNFLTSIVCGGIFYNKACLTPIEIDFCEESDPTWVLKSEPQLDMALGYNEDGSVAYDNRRDMWPADMWSEENAEKYGVSWIYARAETTLGYGNHNHGRQFDNELLFTATYQVKEDAPEGEKLEFFVCDDTYRVSELLYAEYGEYAGEPGLYRACWQIMRVDYPGYTEETYDMMVDYGAFCDQTIQSNTEIVTIGEPATKGEIVEVTTPDNAYIGDEATVDVEVTGAPEALRVTTADGYQVFNREDAVIEATDAGEIWSIDLLVAGAETEYEVVADYGDLGATDATEFVLIGSVKKDLSIHSIEIPDMYPDAQNGGVITAGKHDIIIKTSTDVVKVQFLAADGTTYTYTSWSGAGKVPYEDVDGERTWTIDHSFGPFGTQSLVIRTRSEETLFAATDSTLDATVVY